MMAQKNCGYHAKTACEVVDSCVESIARLPVHLFVLPFLQIFNIVISLIIQQATPLQLISMSRFLRGRKIQVGNGGHVGTLGKSAVEITQLLAKIGKDVGNAVGCAPASLVTGTLVNVLETVQVSNIFMWRSKFMGTMSISIFRL